MLVHTQSLLSQTQRWCLAVQWLPLEAAQNLAITPLNLLIISVSVLSGKLLLLEQDVFVEIGMICHPYPELSKS